MEYHPPLYVSAASTPCGRANVLLPSVAAAGAAEAQGKAAAAAAAKPQAPVPLVGSSGRVSFKNCAAARAAGAAPLYAGQPGYALKLDRDRDGVACE